VVVVMMMMNDNYQYDMVMSNNAQCYRCSVSIINE